MEFSSNAEKILSVYEFGKWYSNKDYLILYRDADQEYHDPTGTIKINAEFDRMLIFTSPNSIVLNSPKTTMRFECVNYIGISEDTKGDIHIRVYCENFEGGVSHKIKLCKISI